jgi:hypothetical protein
MERHGAKVDAIVGGDPRQRSGLPDRIVSRERVWLVEFKGEKTPVRPLQRVIHRERNRYGKNVFIARYPGILIFENNEIDTFENGAQLLQALVRFTNVPN